MNGFDTPEEDRYLNDDSSEWKRKPRCQHEFMDLYGYTGQSVHSKELGAAVFYCQKCLAIRVKLFDVSMFKLPEDDDELR